MYNLKIILLVLNKLFQTQFFLPHNQKHQEKYLKKLIKLNKTTIQNNKKRKGKIKDSNSFSF